METVKIKKGKVVWVVTLSGYSGISTIKKTKVRTLYEDKIILIQNSNEVNYDIALFKKSNLINNEATSTKHEIKLFLLKKDALDWISRNL